MLKANASALTHVDAGKHINIKETTSDGNNAFRLLKSTEPIFESTNTSVVQEGILTSATVLDVSANDGAGGDADAGITYSLGGTDAADFQINSSTGVLTFTVIPDWNNPADHNKDNIYKLNVTANNGADSKTQDISIFVYPESNSADPNIIEGATVLPKGADIFSRATALSISGDGTTIITSNSSGAGVAKIYRFINDNWIQLGNDINGETNGDGFGRSVSISDDGGTVAISSLTSNGGVPTALKPNTKGYAKIYSYDGVSWQQLGETLNGFNSNSNFGTFVSLNATGKIIAMGAAGAGVVQVYQYDLISESWSPLGSNLVNENSGDRFGEQFSLSSDGLTVAVGAPNNDGNGDYSGHVRVYNFNNSDWVQLGNDIDGENAGDFSGDAVSLSADGKTVAIGATSHDNGSRSGHVRIFYFNDTDWVQLGSDIDGKQRHDNLGGAIGLGADGKVVAIGAVGRNNFAGAAIIFYYNGSDWISLEEIQGDVERGFLGSEVSLSNNAETFAVNSKSADGSRIVKLFQLNLPPKVSDVSINGVLDVGETISGVYNYFDPDNDPEAGSTYQWYIADNPQGTLNKKTISGAINSTYTITKYEEGKYLSFEVTPVNGIGTGNKVESNFQGAIPEYEDPVARYGNPNKALSFNSNGYIRVNKTSSLPGDNASDEFSIALWVKTTDAHGALFGDFNSSNRTKNYLAINDGKPWFDQFEPSGGATEFSTQINNDRWVHLVYVQELSTRKLYINGILDDQTANSEPYGGAATDEFILGARLGGSISNFYEGLMDEVSWWNKALNVSEVESLFRDDIDQADNDLIGYFSFDESEDSNIRGTNDFLAEMSGGMNSSDRISGAFFRGILEINKLQNGDVISESLILPPINTPTLTLLSSDGAPIKINNDNKLELTEDVIVGGLYNVEFNVELEGVDHELSVQLKLNRLPEATNVTFTGTLGEGATLTGVYDYSDAENDPESGSTFQWFRADDNNGVNKAAIAGAKALTYTPVAADVSKYISFEVTPKDGFSEGATEESLLQGPIKGKQTITFNALAAKTYGDASFNLTASSDAGLAITYTSSDPNVATISNGNEVTIVGAGSTTITASQAGNTNFTAAADVQQSLTINKATLTATADNKARVYGETNPTLTFSYAGFKNGEDKSVLDTEPTISTTATTTRDVGTVAITLAGGTDNNYDFALNNGTLTINKATLTVTADDQSREYGAANPSLTFAYAGFKNGEDKGVIDTEPTASTTAAATTDVGTETIILAGGTDNNYDFALNNSTLTINKATLTVTANDQAREYGEVNPALTFAYAGFKNGEDKSVIDTEPTISTLATATTNVGTAAITLAGGTDNNYDFTLNNGTLTINKATLAVTVDDQLRVYGDANPILTFAYAGFKNGEDKSVIDTEPTISTLATATTNVGTAAITLAGGADNNYDFTLNNGTLTINKATLRVNADDQLRVYGDANPILTLNYAGLKNGEDKSVIDIKPTASTTATATTNVGAAAITLAGGTDNNYDFTLNNGTLTINKATLTVTADDKARLYGEVNPALTFAYAGFKNGEDKSVLDTEPTISTLATNTTDVGTAAITLAGGTDNNYDFTLNNGTLTINKATLTITADDQSRVYGEANPTLTFAYAGFKNGEDKSVLNTEPTISTTAIATTDVGSIVITLAGGTDNNYDFSLNNGTLTINKATLTVTADDQSREYGEANPTLTFDYAGFKNGEDKSVLDTEPMISTTATATTDVGTAAITLAGGADNNYAFTLNNGTLTINKATLTLTANDQSREYGEANPTLTFDYAGFKNGEDKSVLDTEPTIGITAIATTDVGTVDITLAGGADNNYDFDLRNGGNGGRFDGAKLTITKAMLTVTADDESRAYGEANPNLSFAYAGFKNGEDQSVLDTEPTISTTATATTNVGAEAITLAGGTDNNYDFALNNGTLTINKATLTVTADDQTREYGAANPSLTFVYAGFKNGEDKIVLDTEPTISTLATTTTNVGTADITLAGGTDNNYDFALNNGTLTINKATLTVTADNKARLYGEANPSFTFAYAGFKNGEDKSVLDTEPTMSTLATATTNVGTAAITLAGGTDNNYDFVLNNGRLTINKATLTVTADDQSREYGEANPILTLAYAGFKNGEDKSVLDTEPTMSTLATATTNVGTAVITLAGGTDNNYAFALNNGTLTINKATLTVTADDQSRVYGEANPNLSFVYAGFKNGEDKSVIDTEPTTSTLATATTNVGTAAITLTGGTDNNYDFALNNGTLTINKATLTVTADDKARLYGDANPALTFAYAGFKNGEDKSVIDTEPTISTTATATTDVGTTAITLAGGTDNNYEFTFNNSALIINKATITVTADDQTRVYGEANPFFTLSYTGFKNNEDASVIDTEPIASTTATLTTDVGTEAITLDGAVGTDNNYDFMLSSIDATLTITKATLTVTADDQNREYGEANPSLTFVYAGFKNGEDKSVLDTEPTISTTATTTTDVGTENIILAGGTDNNYDFELNNATLSIKKATLTVTANDQTREYGELNPSLTFDYAGFKNGEDKSVLDTEPTISTAATITTDVGTLAITLAGGTDNNYEFTLNNGTLTISKATLFVTANDLSRAYGDANPTFTFSYAGLKNGEDASVIDTEPTASTTATATTDVGTAAITLTGVGLDNNYDFVLSSTDATLTITKAMLTVTADDQSREYREMNPTLTLTYSGFKNGENQSVLDTEPTISTAANISSIIGTYPITLSGGTAKNYAFTLVSGVLNIFDITAPVISSITRIEADQLNNNKTTADFEVVFTEPVQNVAATSFDVVTTTTATGSIGTLVKVDDETYKLTLTGISGQGTLGLALVDGQSITDLAGNALETIRTAEVYTINWISTAIVLSPSSIIENNAIGDVIGSLTSVDQDESDSHTYTLVAGAGDDDNSSFSISDAFLVAEEVFDYDVKNSYTIRLRTEDGNGGVFEQSILVSIEKIIFITGDGNFEPTILGFSDTQTWTAENRGDKDLEVRLTNGPSGFTLGGNRLIVEAGETVSFDVFFTPNVPEEVSGIMVFEYQGGIETIAVSGEGVIVTSVENPPLNKVEINLYPNPAKTDLTIDLSELENRAVDIRMLDGNGKEVYGIKAYESSTLILPVSGYASGLYLVEFTDGKSIIRKKVMIKK